MPQETCGPRMHRYTSSACCLFFAFRAGLLLLLLFAFICVCDSNFYVTVVQFVCQISALGIKNSCVLALPRGFHVSGHFTVNPLNVETIKLDHITIVLYFSITDVPYTHMQWRGSFLSLYKYRFI